MPRSVKAKHGFTAWAMVMYAFLYLPILVMVGLLGVLMALASTGVAPFIYTLF